MNPTYEKLLRCRDTVLEKIGDFRPRLGIVLGSGLGNLHKTMDVQIEVPYSDIPGFPVSTVAGHAGKYLFGTLEGVPVVCMQGRVHYYEGFDITDVVLPVRVMGLLGIGKLLLTNAAGGTNTDWPIPSMMLIRDHLLYSVPNPLIGPNMDELGVRFPDMTTVYYAELRDIIRSKAAELNLPLQEGVYIQFSGPSYETPAEVLFAKQIGADAIGMSTACEAVAARHMGLRVCGISCIANLGAGLAGHALTHAEVSESGRIIENSMTALVRACVPALDKA